MRLTFFLIISLCSTLLLQAQINVSKTLNLSAGTLSSSLTADEKNSIAYLTLTGTIDARDFKTMRDSLPVLTEVDLSGVSVAGYTGTLGTKDANSFSYYANEIPINAFLDKTSLVSVKLPTNIVSIQQSAFQRCSGLTGTFEIPASVIKFAGYTFYDCTGLSDFNIPKNLISVGSFAFVRCKCSVNVDPENQNLSSDNGILFNKTKTTLIYYPTSKTGGYSIPSTVTNIEDAAFAYCNNLTSLEIPSSVTRIGQWSFDNCTGLTSITLPEKLKAIGFSAFRNCSGLTSVNIPKSVTSIGSNAFITPNLTSIYAYGDIPVNISNSPGVFESVNNTTCTLHVPFGSKTVYQSASQWQDFSNIVEMDQTLTMPLNVTAGSLAALLPQSVRDTLTYLSLTGTIDARDFKTMRDSLPLLATLDIKNVNIVEYVGPDGPSMEGGSVYPSNAIPEFAFMYKKSLLSIDLPISTTVISVFAFGNNWGLTSITISSNVLVIKTDAFAGCHNITQINIPASVQTIENAFDGNQGLFNVEEGNQNYSSLDGVLFDKSQKTLISCPRSKSGSYTIPGTVEVIGNIAFGGCYKLTSIHFSPSVKKISYAAFDQCSGVAEFELPSSIEYIGNRAFFYCSGITSFKVKWQKPLDLTGSNDVFLLSNISNCTLKVPFGTSNLYDVAEFWKDFGNIVEMEPNFEMPLNVAAGGLAALLPQSVRDTLTYLSLSGTIDARDFKTMRDSLPLLAEIDLSGVDIVDYTGNEGTLSGYVTYPSNSVPESALSGKVSLTSIILNNNITNISYEAFLSCSSLELVVLPSSLISISSRAFGWCALNSITLPDALQSIGNYAFSTNNLQSVDISASVHTIGLAVFYQNRSLSEISVNTSNSNYCSIDGVLFNKNHTELLFYPNGKANTDYVLPDGVIKIIANSFNGGNSVLKNLTIPEGVIEIGSWAFANLINLESIDFPSSIAVISDGAFIGQHDNLQSIKIRRSTPVAISQDALGDVNKATCKLYVPFGSKAAYLAAAQWQDFQNIIEMEPNFEMPLNVAAGGLAALLPQSVRDTITYLALTGTIDARDFKTMRDSLPLLANLDLSGVNITEYIGTEGTSIRGETTYAANAIPEFAFCNSFWQGKTSLKTIEFPLSINAIQYCAFVRCNNLKILNIPEGVSAIGDAAFSECLGLVKINIPSTVSNIRDDAFRNSTGQIIVNDLNANYSGIDGVLFSKDGTNIIHCPIDRTGKYIIPESVTNIGWIAFDGCKNITSITIPSNVSQIGVYAFMMQNGSSLSELITLSITPITFQTTALVFEGINKTTCTLYVPYGSKAAYQAAAKWQDFQNIVEMEPNLTMPLNVAAGGFAALLPQSVRDTLTYLSLTGTIDARDFKTMRDSLPLLEKLDLSYVSIVAYNGNEGTSIEGNTIYPANTIPEYAFLNSNWQGKNSLKSIVFPVTLTEIGMYSFTNCNGLITVNLPNGLTKIGSTAFATCNAITAVNIPASVNLIETGAFRGCPGNFYVDPDNKDYSGNDGVLFNKNQTELIQFPTLKTGTYKIPYGIKIIGNFAFFNCQYLTAVEIPNSVEEIKWSAFFSCPKLTEVEIPKSVIILENSAFQSCIGLVSVKIPMSVKNIQSRAFYDCRNLSSITSYLLTPVDLTSNQDVFKDINKTTCILYVPHGSKAAYQAANQWQDFLNIVEMDETNLFDEVNIIRNGKFDLVEANGMPTYWGGWVDGSYGASDFPCTVVNGVAVLENTKAHPSENWHYQFYQSNLTALQNIPYVVSFVAWADNGRQISFDFEDSSANNYNRYGYSPDSEALAGSSEWEFPITTVPTRYTFHVTFDQIIPTTIQNLRFFLSKDLGKVYLDSVSVISENDLIIIDSLPTVKTLSISSVTPGSAVCEGNVISGLKYPITERGICWSTSTNPSVADSKTTAGNGNGNFTGNITGLMPSTTYFARAYATNEKGTSYGKVLEFTTGDCSGNIGMVGTFNNWGTNNSDVLLQPSTENQCVSSVIQKFSVNGEVKFRKNYDWNINWGNWNFPVGTGIQNGPNIPVPAGTYKISFNSSTGEYNFESIIIKCNQQDSLALVAIYNATNGANWNRKDNWLTGNVQNWYGVTMNTDGRITELNLVRNGLKGYIPSEIGNLTELKKLCLGNNMFVVYSGTRNIINQQQLPVTLANLAKLEILSLDNNSMYNELPDVFGGMTELKELYIQNCYFLNQSLPANISNCSKLTRLDIYYNNFYELPELSGLSSLNVLLAYGCFFGFEDIEPNLWIPQFYYENQRLILGKSETINPVAGETINHTIDAGGVNNIYQWYKDGQELSGQNTKTLTIENVDSNDAGIYMLQISNSVATQLILKSEPIILYQSQMPEYKALEALYNNTGGDNWKNKENWLSNEPITKWFGIGVNPSTGLIYISLYDNNLVGSLPQEIGDLKNFYQIEIAGNPGLTGEIPASIGQLTNLQYLYLYDNNFTGVIPSSVGQMTDLQYLYLRNNSLNGNLPGEIGNLSNLYFLEISNNQIENLPEEITNCSKLKYFHFNNNRISSLPNLSEMNNLYRVYAFSNKLEFDDVIPIAGQFSQLSYAPQDSIGEAMVVTKGVGESYSYTLVTPGDQNQYQWYKNDVVLTGKTNATIEFSTLAESDKGKYYCLVTNPQAPDLTLVSRKITLNVESVDNLKMLSLTSLVPLSNIMNARAFCNLGDKEPIAVRFTNSGKKSVSNIILGFKIDGITVAEEIFNGTVNPGDTLDYTFSKKADLSTNQYYKSFAINCYLGYNDENPADNSITKTRNTFGNYTDLQGWTTYNSCDGMLSDISWAIAEDKNGDIWSTDFFGASKFDGNNWSTFTTANGLGQAYNWAMINDRTGNIWMTGNNNSVITKYDGSQFVKYPQNGVYEECIYADTKGNIWFGSWSGYGVLKFDGNTWTQYPAADYGFGSYVVSIGEDKNGKMYFASANGVRVFDGINWSTLNMPDQNLYISEIFFDSKGFTWFTSGGSFYKYDGTNWNKFTVENDGTINGCEDISEDIYGNIWFAGGNEIVKYDGNTWTKFSTSDGLACGIKSIYTIHCDRNGNVWTGSYGGGISKLEQSNVCPKHFQTVWEGTSGVDHMNINIIEAKYDDLDLEAGDEVGVFDGDICVGTGKLTKTIDQQNLLTIKVSRNDGSGNGFTSGHDVTYKFWDCSAESEYEVSGVHCFNNKLTEVTCQPFETGATAYVKLSGISVICQKIGFRTGWNIFSVPSVPNPAEMGILFQPAITNSSLVKIQDEAGNSMEDWGIFGGWQDNIGSISPTEGYKIKVSKTDSVEICGVPVKYPYAIPMNAGWNIIGYPQTKAIDGLNVLQQLIDRGVLIKVQDELGNSIEDWSIFGGWQNNIGDFMAGEGYKVKVSAKDTLWIYDNYPKSTTILPELSATIHFQPEFEGNGVDHMNINVVGLPANIVKAGDELAVFDNETCVGAVTIMPYHLENQSVSIAASATDNQGMPGFTEGSRFTLKLWKSLDNREFTLEPEIVKGTETFTKHETTVASLEKYATTGFDGIPDLSSSEINCYPNPFSDEVTIKIDLESDSEVSVEVFNQSSQKVKTIQPEKNLVRGSQIIKWNGKTGSNQQVSTGVYFLKITIDKIPYFKKVVYSKTK